MPASPRVAAVVLAAGRAARFGGGKLGQAIAPGVSVLARSVLGALAPASGLGEEVWLVGRHDELAPWLGQVEGDRRLHHVAAGPAGGQGDSLAAGVRALPAGCAIVVLLADQPFATPAAAASVIARYRAEPALAAVAAARGGRRMPPALFAPRLRPELEALCGEPGARALLARPDAAAVELGDGDWCLDLDRPEDLAGLRAAAARDALLAPRQGAPA